MRDSTASIKFSGYLWKSSCFHTGTGGLENEQKNADIAEGLDKSDWV